MNMITLGLANLRYNRAANILNIMVLALGIAIIVTLIHVNAQVQRRFERDLEGIDLVVGAKGSPIQLVLASLLQMDVPSGAIPLSEAVKLEKNPLVKTSIPILTQDNYKGFRIVGTVTQYPAHYGATLAQGNYWKQPMQAVLGSEVARVTGMKIGKALTGTHGFAEGGEEHREFPYTITGILAPTGTVLDRLVLTDISSVWRTHEHYHETEDDDHERRREKEVTALLLTYKSPQAETALLRQVNRTSQLQAVSPAPEMTWFMKIIGTGGDAIEIFGAVLIVIAATGFFMTLFNAVSERQYDIALLRILGATRSKIFAFVMSEGLILGTSGTALGIVLGHLFSAFVRHWFEVVRHVSLVPVGFHPYELCAAAAAILMSAVASFVPAYIACRLNVAQVMSGRA